ncbi:MAG: sulfatase/phosphatase domain-containing protein, partial [Promethearchaeota archaeon]
DLDELYDLEKDPWELTNLINDPGYEEILTDLKERLKKWREKTGDKVTRKNIMGRHLKGL